MEIIVSGEIGPWTEREFDELEGDVLIRLNSEGGDVFSALAIYNRLRQHAGTVTIVVEGLCASAATVVACGGRCVMCRKALMMMHNPVTELEGWYDSADVTRRLSMLRAVEDVLIDVYALKTGRGREEMRERMASEEWLSASGALELGMADELKEETEMDNETLLAKVKAFFGREKTEREKALEAEVERLKVELTRSERERKTADEIYALIESNVKSGASEVRASGGDELSERIAAVVKYGNRRV